MNVRVNKFENFFFAVKVLCTVLIWVVGIALVGELVGTGGDDTVATASVIGLVITYAALIVLFVIFQKIFLVAYLKGNGIAITERQFPEAFAMYSQMARELGVRKTPPLFLIQQGGALNAFAVKFSGKHYVAIYSDVFNLIQKDPEIVKFILGHELGHIKRNHLSKRFWTCPSSLIPFLTAAYSRCCEYTCDNIGQAFSRDGAKNGLLALAAGTKLYDQVNVENYIQDSRENYSFAVKFVNLFNSHPYLPKRLDSLRSNGMGD